MNLLQQEIRRFHENLNPTLEKVLELYRQNDQKVSQRIYHTVIRPCKRLQQKCSFKSLLDSSRLCSLTYWLYIYEHKELALELCERTHDAAFVWEPSWSGGYPEICGLEIRIARELLGENRKTRIPADLLEYYLSRSVQKELRYPQVLREEQISTCNDRRFTLELLYALYNLIGRGETGLYPELNQNWGEIEKTVQLYLEYLRMG